MIVVVWKPKEARGGDKEKKGVDVKTRKGTVCSVLKYLGPVFGIGFGVVDARQREEMRALRRECSRLLPPTMQRAE
jgi:hypothetical protein